MGERIYVRTDGAMEVLEEQDFGSEDAIQRLIAEHPDLVGGGRIRPDEPRRWILVTREQGVAEESGAGDRWAVDHLLIDQDAVPTLVEVKRGSNSQVRREVVGQLLEYAAHARRSWDADDLRRAFEERSDDPDAELAALLDEDEPDPDGFWQRVETNLRASNLRLLFVADRIPGELARVVEFLNEQTRGNIEVLAVEVKRYAGDASETFVPRVIGALPAPPAKSGSGRKRLTRAALLDAIGDHEHRAAAERLLDTGTRNGARISWGVGTVSIRAATPLRDAEPGPRMVSLAWLHRPGRPSMGRDITFGASFSWWSSLPDRLRALLEAWADQWTDIGKAAGAPGDQMYAVSYDDAAAHIDTLTERLERVLADLRAL